VRRCATDFLINSAAADKWVEVWFDLQVFERTNLRCQDVASVIANELSCALPASVFCFDGAVHPLPTLPTYVQGKANDLAVVGVVLLCSACGSIIRLPLASCDWLAGANRLFDRPGAGRPGRVDHGHDRQRQWLDDWTRITGPRPGGFRSSGFSALFRPRSHQRCHVFNSVGRVRRPPRRLIWRILLFSWHGHLRPFHSHHSDYAEIRRPLTAGGSIRLIVRRDVLVPSLLSAVGQYAHWAISLGFMSVLVKQLGGTGVTQSLFASLNIAMMASGNLGASSIASRLRGQWLASALG
jgi:hypothetical protein